jgi:uncharacterized membrane protein YphA (DoxX/SURF4 family)
MSITDPTERAGAGWSPPFEPPAPEPPKRKRDAPPSAIETLALLAGLACVVAGVWFLAGLGWTLVACGVVLILLACMMAVGRMGTGE